MPIQSEWHCLNRNMNQAQGGKVLNKKMNLNIYLNTSSERWLFGHEAKNLRVPSY